MPEGSVLSRCSACSAKNRLPLERVAEHGRCGRCGGELPPGSFFANQPVEVGEGRFDLVTRLSPLPVLVDFWAPWCGPCRFLAPVLEQLARELTEKLLIVKVNTERAPSTAQRYGVQAIPTLILMRSGIEVDRITGALPMEALKERVSRFL